MKFRLLSLSTVVFMMLILVGCNSNAVSFEINFDTNGGTDVESITYDGKSTITIPDNPTKEGFIFDGWFWDNGTFLNPFTANSLLDTPIEEDLTVYAKWVAQDDELTAQLKNIYLLAVQVNAFQGTYEEWLETVRGPQGVPGADGKSSFLRVNGSVLEWQQEGDVSWTALFDLNSLKGSSGLDGKSISLKVANGYIQWQYQGDITWTNLVELTTLVGPAGADGVDGINGKEVTFQVSEGFIQWQYVGDITWNNLIDLATITGADGSNGTDGVDGREVLFQVAEGYIQWQYQGDTEWSNLININTLTGVQGVGIASTSINEFGELIITYTDNTVVNIGTIYKVFTVNFVGLEGYLIDSQTVIYGSEAVAPTAPIVEGYTFIEWSLTFTNITANTSINAIYQVNTYTITFETNGGVAIDPIANIEYNSTIDLPIPTKDGYVFMGWYYGEDINSGQFTSQSIVKDNLTLYARWAINAYTVTFDSNGGTAVESQVVEDNDKVIKPVDPTKEGYTFLGWFINGDEKWVFGGYDVTQNITLTAHWSINSYMVAYVQNNDQEDLSLTVHPFTELIQPSKTGYMFAGWFTTIGFEENTSVDIMPADNVTLYAKWVIVNYQIDYVLDGGVNNDSNPNTYTIVTNTITLNDPTKEGYTFLGWYAEDAFINEVTEITLGSVDDLTLYAKWSINQYTITFDTDGGSTIGSITQDYDSLITVPINPTKAGYAFIGWDITIPSHMPSNNLTIKALWEVDAYTITYVLNGGTNDSNNPSEFTIFTESFIYGNPTKEGHTFDGWYQNSDFSGTKTTFFLEGTSSDITLYSKWNINSYTINYYVQPDDYDPLKDILLAPGETIIQISLGYYHSAALTSNGRLFTWGNNGHGQLGDGTTTSKSTPTEITSRFSLATGDKIIQVLLGYSHSAVLTSSGRLFTWGYNYYGQLGDGTTTDRYASTEITSRFSLVTGDKIIQVSLGYYHSAALTSSGRLFTWGNNSDGKIGDGTTTDRSTPTEITSRFSLATGDKIIEVSLGDFHSAALTSNGRLFTWGSNGFGKLGDGTTTNRFTPTEITSRFSLATGDKIIEVSLGDSHSAALTSNGRLFTWGYNGAGQLGDGTTTNKSTPTEITNRFSLATGDQIIQVSLGSSHSAALTSNGRLFTWGYNYYGGLGDGTTTAKSTPTEITNRFSLATGDQIIQVSLGYYHSAALTSSGRLFTWGFNDYGMLGDGTTTSKSTPTEISQAHYELVLSDTVVYNQSIIEYVSTREGYTFSGWYSDVYLNTPYTFTTMPAEDITLHARWIPIDYTISYILDSGTNSPSNPSIYTVATNTITLNDPIKEGYTFLGWYTEVTYINIVTEITIGSFGDVSLYAKWSINQYTINFNSNGGSSVDSITQDYGTTVIQPANPTRQGYNFAGWYSNSKLTTAYTFSTMPTANITLYAKWDPKVIIVTFVYNNGTADEQVAQYAGSTLVEPTYEGYAFDGWYFDSDFITEYIDANYPTYNTTLYAKWNVNSHTVNYYVQPDDYGLLKDILLAPGETIESISLGDSHSAAITSTGRIFTWGRNFYGRLGDGTTTDRYTPTEITSQFNLGVGETIESISLGGLHSSAITSIGRIFTWGYNKYGQLGDGTIMDRYTPTEITSQFNLGVGETIESISLGLTRSSAITSTGRIFTWGDNWNGQLGDGTTTDKSTPTEITSQFNLGVGETIESISLSLTCSSAITSTGRIFTWGNNDSGQLGDGTTTNQSIPTEITSQFNLGVGETIESSSLGYGHSSAITSTGRIFTWGNNWNGQLGDGTNTDRYTPIEITSQFNLGVGETIESISLGGYHSSAITSTGRIFTWGDNWNGQLGDGTTTDKSTPTEITSQFNLGVGETIESISLGEDHSSAITSTGRIYTWGENDYGQLGDGTTTNQSTPIEITQAYLELIHSDTLLYNQIITEYLTTREGYIFSGWYSDIYLTQPYTFTTMPDKDITLYGKWELAS